MSELFEGYRDAYDAEARLVILKALVAEDNGRLSDSLLLHAFKAFAINKGRAYLRTQLNWLEDEAGAVILHRAGTALIAELTERGQDHLERAQLIEGIKPPSFRRG